MSKKKTVAKLGAGVLAAATVMSGLSFGPIAAQAASPSTSASASMAERGFSSRLGSALQVEVSGSLRAGSKSDWIYIRPSAGDYQGNGYLTVPAGLTITDYKVQYNRNGEWLDLVVGDPNFEWKYTLSDQGRQLRVASNQGNNGDNLHWGPQAYRLAARVDVSGDFRASSATLRFKAQRVLENGRVEYDNTADVAVATDSAAVKDVDVDGGSALLDGVAPKNATAVEVSYTDKDGKKKVRNATVTDGKWSQPLTALALGKTTVHLTAFDGVENIAESDVEVDLPVTPLTARGEFSTEHVEEVATVVGTATNDTTINAYAGDKKVATTMSGPEGDFELAINPPNKAGEYPLRVTQQIRDEDATPQDVELDYGTGVTITNPQPDTEYEAGDPVIISGDAQRGSIVKVYEKGNPRVVLGQMTATNGYRIVLDDLEDREYDLVVAGISKGNNRTTSEVTINPGKNSLEPATVTTTEFTAGTTNTFEGTATPDATLHFVDAEGNDILGHDITATGGEWSFTKSFPADAREFSFRIVQTKGAETATSDLFTLKSDVAGFDPVEMTTKTVIPGLENRFTGTATPGASLRVLNVSGTQIVNGTINADPDNGTFTFNRVVSANATKLDFKIEQTKDGKKVTSPMFSLAADATAAPAPVAVENTAVEAGVENTFTGTGPADAKFRVLNLSNTQIVPGEFDIESDGKWQFSRVVSRTATKFDFKLEITLPSGQVYRTKAFSLQASAFRPVTVDQKSVTPGVSNHFSGTATPDATFRVLNVSGTQIVPGTLVIGSDGKWQFDRVVSSTATNFRFKLEVTKNGQSETSKLFELAAR
jgi:hypothetical protein